MNRMIVLLLCLLLFGGRVAAQEVDSRYATRATTFGVGRVNLLETYLSPREYTGPELTFMHETLRKGRGFSGRMIRQMLWQVNFSATENSAGNGDQLAGLVSWNMGWYTHWTPLPNLRLLAGGQYSMNLGVVYNSRNSNNPAQAKCFTHLAASGIAIYKFELGRYPMVAKYQLDMPLLGVAFSPNYTQSYYEIFSLGQYDKNVRCTYPGNAPSWRQQLSIDLPISNSTLRLGYLMDIRQSALNNLKSHAYSHAFMVGYVRYLERYGAKEKRVINSFLY